MDAWPFRRVHGSDRRCVVCGEHADWIHTYRLQYAYCADCWLESWTTYQRWLRVPFVRDLLTARRWYYYGRGDAKPGRLPAVCRMEAVTWKISAMQ